MPRYTAYRPLLAAAIMLTGCNTNIEDTPSVEANGVQQITNGAAQAPAAPDLFSRYIGKFPFEKVGPHSWNDDPAVIAAVEAAISDAMVRKWVLTGAGPSSPIALFDGKVGSWACEQHNCGPHQWVTLIDPKTGKAEVCYYQEEAAANAARWFKERQEEKRSGKCPEV